MARTKGTYNLSANIEANASAPLDARDKVATLADLTANNTFAYPYEGMQVYVVSEKKRYTLIGSDPTVSANWQESGSGSITIDDDIDVTSENPVQNKVIANALGGKADLVDGKVPANQLPSFVDDVLEYASVSAFPVSGEDGKIYVAKDVNKSYRWTGSTYVALNEGVALGETSSTAYRGDRGKIAYDDSQANKTNIGTLSNLVTTEKSNLVGAVNEVANTKQNIMQVSYMPEVSATNVDKIIQYVGETTINNVNGYFYKCVDLGGEYAWQECPVQDNNVPYIDAQNVGYDSTGTNLTSDNVKDALDEVSDIVTPLVAFVELNVGEVYTFANRDWICAEAINRGYVLQAMEHVTLGRYPGDEMTGPTGSTGKPWGESGIPYVGSNIDGENISSYNEDMLSLYNSIKEAENKRASYGSGLYIVGTNKIGTTFPPEQGTTEYNYWYALKNSIKIISGSHKESWIGEYVDGGWGYQYGKYIDAEGKLNTALQGAQMFVTPAFNVDASKIDVSDHTITLASYEFAANKIPYDNTISELSSTNVQDAIDETVEMIDESKVDLMPVSEVVDILRPTPSPAPADKGSGNPTGTIISFMGTIAPDGYLACDGTVYNIADYTRLANFFELQFGSKNNFGGDGTTTFAVPDLRGEFLRGTGINSHEYCGDGANVGVHQDGSAIRAEWINPNGSSSHTFLTNVEYQNAIDSKYPNNVLNSDDIIFRSYISGSTGLYERTIGASVNNIGDQDYGQHFVVRPTNTSILYCIKD